MFFSCARKILSVFKTARSFSCCSVLHISRESVETSKAYKLMSPYQSGKRRKKKTVVVKRVADDIEAVWLENLNCDNLSLYRKTSFGSFRRVNLENLLSRLREIYPSTFTCEPFTETNPESTFQITPVTSPETTTIHTPVPEETKSDGVKASPCLSDYLIKHITQFPLLKTEDSKSITKLAELEKEDFGDVDVNTFPSVTRVLSDTMSEVARQRLKKWKKRMISELGEDGFIKYQEDLLTEGKKFHSTLKTYLEVADKSLVKIDPSIEGCWKSLEKTFPDIGDVIFVEEAIYHPVLMYKGIVDCVANYRGTPCVIEWKKSGQTKSKISSTYDAPLQLCAYLGALPWNKNLTVKKGLVVVAYNDGSPAKIFELSLESCEVYWIEWLRRLQNYWLRRSPMILQFDTNL